MTVASPRARLRSRPVRQRLAFLATSALAISLMACGTRHNSGSNANATVAANRPAASTSDRLLAAAEPFELLTETAFSDPPTKLNQTISQGRRAVADIRPLLTPATAKTIDGLLEEVVLDRASDQRADLAISSIEIYRNIVSSIPAGTKVPTDVSLLDYAGFRFQADLKTAPVRWDDMRQALHFAQSRWAALAPKIADKAVSGPFEAALQNMEKAVANRDAKLAASSVTAELDQVDKLEQYFSAK
jgi:hypothetical protein